MNTGQICPLISQPPILSISAFGPEATDWTELWKSILSRFYLLRAACTTARFFILLDSVWDTMKFSSRKQKCIRVDGVAWLEKTVSSDRVEGRRRVRHGESSSVRGGYFHRTICLTGLLFCSAWVEITNVMRFHLGVENVYIHYKTR